MSVPVILHVRGSISVDGSISEEDTPDGNHVVHGRGSRSTVLFVKHTFKGCANQARLSAEFCPSIHITCIIDKNT